jgi:hypothetical protein
MGLFGQRRNRSRLRALDGAPEGVAVIRTSDPAGRSGGPDSSGETIFDLDLNVVGTRAYQFTLEVRVPGRDPYEVSGRFDVPRKAENVGPFDRGNALKPGVELPVRVDPGDPSAVAIDWDRFLGDPGRKKAVKAASDAGRRRAGAGQLAKNPKLQAQHQAANRDALGMWIYEVQSGRMSREEFDATVNVELESGRMDPADAEAGWAVLDSNQ